MTRLFNRTQFVAVSAVLVGLLFMIQPAQAWWPFGHNNTNNDISVEDVYYYQDILTTLRFDELSRENPDRRDLYVVGVAGHSGQDAFRIEIEALTEIISNFYDTSDRTLLLVNNKDTTGRYPLANEPNLRRTLVMLADKMDYKEDVLLLVMTSEGVPGRFSTWFPPLYPKSLTPAHVKNALDLSSIVNRVIIIQSCYSGSFIEELKGPNTLIITSTDGTSSSTGCTVGSRWSFFNSAYFDVAFRGMPRFVEAFSKAQQLIADWQINENGTRKIVFQPQISIGENIVEILKQLEIDQGVMNIREARADLTGTLSQ